MNLSPLTVGLVITAFTALLAGLGWLIVSQVETNKSLAKSIHDAITEFKVAMSLLEERSNTQKTLCQFYRNQIDSRNKGIDIKIEKIENKLDHVNNHQNH